MGKILKKQGFAFDVSGLSGTYADEVTNLEMLVALQYGTETAQLTSKQTGIKSSSDLHTLDNTVYLQDGTACGIDVSGTTTLDNRTITTYPIKVQNSWCIRDLEAKWTQVLLSKGQNYTEADLPKAIIEDIVKQIAKKLEVADWSGDTDNWNTDLNQYDGLRKIIKAASGVVAATTSTYNETNCRTILRNVVYNIPAALKGDTDVICFIGYPEFETYRNKLAIDNLYHYNGESNGYEMKIENSNITLKAVHGLDNTAEIYCMKPSNAYCGMDNENEQEEVKLWYSMDDDKVYSSIRFRRGWQIGVPSEIVYYKNT